ncbi:MAG: trimethylamine methyltransferase family protein [Anaerolineae bacterium]|nr:trimethylamine methyltransferase family protein [Anaerolineae bacterium]
MPALTGIPELHHWRVITDDEIERIRAGALRILANAGFRILSRPILERLERRGMRVDYATGAVRPTPKQMELIEETARAHASTPRDEPVLRRPLPAGEHVGHNYTCYYDHTEGIRRPATLQDIRNVVRAWHMLPEIVETRTCMTAQDVPPPIEPILSTVEVMKLTDKIKHCPELMLPSQLPYLEALETIMAGRETRYHSNGCSVNHFTLDERAAGCLLAVASHGLEHWWVNSCPVAGANAPVTLAGATVVGVAETLGGWLAGWALNEDVSLGAIPLAGIMDMRTTRVLFSTPESILIDCALYQYFYRLYGIRIGLCAGYTDAKVPSMQAINDKMLKALAYGLFTDHLGGQTGTLEAGNVYSPTQQVIDLELNRQIAQLARGMEVNDGTLALDEIERFARDDRQSFLLMDHTVDHWRDALWLPTLMDRTSFDSPEAERIKERQIVERAEARWREALARYEPPALDDYKVKAAEKVLASARKVLL